MEWRVFVIGPMSKRFPNHIEKLHEFFADDLVKHHGCERVGMSAEGGLVLKNGKDTVVAFTPRKRYLRADIPTNVFHQIDNADLIIADLSGNRPPVVYELAMAHALGVDTILVGGRTTQTFYFSQIHFHGVDFSEDPITSESLSQDIDLWMRTRRKLRAAQNPLQAFYGAPLLDISAASGLAAGFYDNFARPILVGGEIVQRRRTPTWLGLGPRREYETTRSVKGLIVLRPESLTAEIPEIEADLAEVLNRNFGAEVLKGKPNHLFIRVRRQSISGTEDESRIPFFLVGDYVIDIPRTIFSLKLSRRLGRLLEVRDADVLLDHGMQHVLIECFLHNLQRLIQSDRSTKGKLFRIATADELPAVITHAEGSHPF